MDCLFISLFIFVYHAAQFFDGFAIGLFLQIVI